MKVRHVPEIDVDAAFGPEWPLSSGTRAATVKGFSSDGMEFSLATLPTARR